ncbi:MAG: hypothetical protein M1828_002184 [Chrysothrix sp. TS-e1954]|nr:MAG: hypothetical protein M1828_002184 [Chrysothrix sp. TS-e1954]
MNESHSRTQALLLIQKLLDCRDNSSPLILILDSIAQTARPLLQEYVQRAKVRRSDGTTPDEEGLHLIRTDNTEEAKHQAHRTKVVFVAFETLRPPAGVDEVIRAHESTPATLQQQIAAKASEPTRTLIILDSLRTLCSDASLNIAHYLGNLIAPDTTLLTVFHVDQPLSRSGASPYAPSSLTLLKYLATTVLTMYSLAHILAKKSARERSLAPPRFGLDEEKEGIIQGLGSCDSRGIVIEMEHRRKSGRAVSDLYFLPTPKLDTALSKPREKSQIILLADHPLYGTPTTADQEPQAASDLGNITFDLGLTEKQRRDREEVVLPYYDAQRGSGPGEGGRILYDMGVEDDFDEEEDEI